LVLSNNREAFHSRLAQALDRAIKTKYKQTIKIIMIFK